MGPEADLLFSTARMRMTDEIASRIRAAVRRDVNWIYLIQLAMQHETTALLYWNLQHICPDSVPPGILEPLAARYHAQAVEARQRAEELVRILRALQDQGVFALGYKGPMLAQRLYGDLSLREFSEFSDLDIMIRECDLLKARDVILNQGYRLGFLKPSEVSEYARTNRELHFCRERDGERMLELHWRFMVRSACVRNDPERFLQRFETISFAGTRVRSLPLEVYFLVLSLHATKHKWRKLKLICDIAEILGSHGLDWEYVAREAEDLGLRRMLAVGIALAEDPLQVAAPLELTRVLRIDRSARALAAECRQGLLQEPDETWRTEAEYKFLLKSRERLQDKATMILFDQLLPKITPDERDRRFARLPESLSSLYYFVRPVRMAWEKITETHQEKLASQGPPAIK
jgi:hypothetical protein